MTPLENAHHIPTHMAMSEKDVLFNLACSLPSKAVAVEIGSYLGASSYFLATGLATHLYEGVLYCVDTWNNDAMSHTHIKTNIFDEFLKNTKDVSENIIPIRSTSVDAAAAFTKPVDLIFFDGDHSYEGIHEDWNVWKRHLNQNAIVVFHDWGWADGVKQVILQEVKPLVRKFDCLPNLWWGYL